jgi:hypothetical protein
VEEKAAGKAPAKKAVKKAAAKSGKAPVKKGAKKAARKGKPSAKKG